MRSLAIEARNVHKTYHTRHGGKLALEGIDLEVPVGSIFGLLGPNGAGKSTFINILAGLVIKDSGLVRIWGFDQEANPRTSRAMIGVVPQELNIDPFFTPFEVLELQAGLYAVPKSRRRTMEILEAMGLANEAHGYTRSLSGGMRRRLLVAKALVHNPPVLVLDEPTAGVDVELRIHLWEYVRSRNAAGTTVILTTHYLEEAEELCDTIAILQHGRVVACEEKHALLRQSELKSVNIFPAKNLTELPADLVSPAPGASATIRPDGAIRVTFSRSQTPIEEILDSIRGKGIRIQDITTDEQDLRDVFLALTGKRLGDQ